MRNHDFSLKQNRKDINHEETQQATKQVQQPHQAVPQTLLQAPRRRLEARLLPPQRQGRLRLQERREGRKQAIQNLPEAVEPREHPKVHQKDQGLGRNLRKLHL